LSLGRAEEQSNIDDSSNVDPTIIELSDYHDDQHEQDDGDPHYWSEVET
jgi:ABC-type Zn uptake system ZnuABC Zn-binding protein ZnuA